MVMVLEDEEEGEVCYHFGENSNTKRHLGDAVG